MCEIFGIGTDITDIGRMEKLIGDDRFMNRYFTEEEREYVRSKNLSAAQSAAGIYAAKEAALKAMGTGIAFELTEIGVTHDEKGKPLYSITGKAAEFLRGRPIHLSVSHDGGMAVAFCVIENRSEV